MVKMKNFLLVSALFAVSSTNAMEWDGYQPANKKESDIWIQFIQQEGKSFDKNDESLFAWHNGFRQQFTEGWWQEFHKRARILMRLKIVRDRAETNTTDLTAGKQYLSRFYEWYRDYVVDLIAISPNIEYPAGAELPLSYYHLENKDESYLKMLHLIGVKFDRELYTKKDQADSLATLVRRKEGRPLIPLLLACFNLPINGVHHNPSNSLLALHHEKKQYLDYLKARYNGKSFFDKWLDAERVKELEKEIESLTEEEQSIRFTLLAMRLFGGQTSQELDGGLPSQCVVKESLDRLHKSSDCNVKKSTENIKTDLFSTFFGLGSSGIIDSSDPELIEASENFDFLTKIVNEFRNKVNPEIVSYLKKLCYIRD